MSYRIKTYLILGAYFLAGIIFGLAISKIPHPKLLRLPSVAQDKPNSVTIDIVKENDEILVYEHTSNNLIFEYNKNKPEDKNAYKEFNDLWRETQSY